MKANPYKKKRINIHTLGCSKNVYDSEYLMGLLKSGHLEVVHEQEPEKDDVVVVNTCGFIRDAKEESINTILEFAGLKNDGEISELNVIGCLSERYKEDLTKELPEVDRFFGVNNFEQIVEHFGVDYKHSLLGERQLTTPSHYTYLKISDGCNRKCSFCAIPLIKGFHISRPLEHVVSEAALLSARGVKELILIGQDTTYYGVDLYKKKSLDRLLTELAGTHGIEWIRLQYAYPAGFPLKILPVIRDHENICNYLDMPVQHISDHVLKKMRRAVSAKITMELLEKIKIEVPGIALRTTLIVGHPGETDKEFQKLYDFIEAFQFDRLGVFTYSPEENTFGYNLGDPVPEKVKLERRDAIMELQRGISLEKNQGKVGHSTKVIIDRKEGDYYIGRTEHDTPEVDNEVLVQSATPLTTGSFYQVEITDATEYELMAKY